MRFTASVTGANGDEQFPIEVRPEQTVGEVRQKLTAQGYTLVGLEPVPTPSTTTTATTTLPALRGVGNAADVAQTATGLATGRLPAVVRHGAPLVARGLVGAAMQPTSPGIGPVPPGQNFAARARREAGRGVVGEGLAAGLPSVASALRSVPGFVGRALSREGPASLPELRALAQKTGSLPLPGLGGALRAEGAATTRTTVRAFRAAFGRAETDPEVGEKAVAKGLKGLLTRLPNTHRTTALEHVPTAAAVLEKVHTSTGIRLGELSEGQIAKLLREDPRRLVEAFRILGTEVGGETGQALTRPVAESLVARAASRSIRRPPGGGFPGNVGGGILDPHILLRELGALQKRLGDAGVHAVFGPGGMQAFRQVTQSLAGVTGKLAPAGARKTGDVAIRLFPLVAAMAAGAAVGGRMGEVVEIAAGVGSLREMRDLLPRLLASEPGLRLVAAWLDGETRRIPDRLLIPALARMVPGVVRSLQTGGGGVAGPSSMAPGPRVSAGYGGIEDPEEPDPDVPDPTMPPIADPIYRHPRRLA